MTRATQSSTLSAMFVALGVLLPILFHAVGMGSIFLPMFWPVAICAFYLPLSYAVAIGILTPVLSTLLTGMPPISPPILYLMIFELGFLAGITNIVYRHTRWGIFWPLLLGLFVSRSVLFFAVIPLASLLGLPPKLASIALVAKGIPGVLIILTVIPLLVNRLKHDSVFARRA